MIKGKFQSAVIASLLLAASNANATLEPRLNGQAYYDTETNLTWTADPNLNDDKNLEEQFNFLSSLSIEGVSDWRIPSEAELRSIVSITADCPWPGVCFQVGPFEPWAFRYWYLTSFEGPNDYLAHGSDGRYYFAYSPSWDEYFPADVHALYSYFAVWPVHTGDVAAISAVPEPETYAMLLAGLGLLGFMARRKKESVV